MPRRERNPGARIPLSALLQCKACGKQCKNKSGLTQHSDVCHVILDRRLRRPEQQLHQGPQDPQAQQEPDVHLPEQDEYGIQNAFDFDDVADGLWDENLDQDNGEMVDAQEEQPQEEQFKGLTRDFHEGLTGAFKEPARNRRESLN